ncbi:amidase (macronuclear) [Tetrahymena thermophila SB210]|uniref:Amidase n=1 Tax=Tetrahymena thermophila (strain SB210) TaxID=312017 RepID=Q22PK6_TETTS|nr:amidase [Tetrahymena thermophila SB210]EAR87103.1 amidase [Tetrahymena thermophila SB210]|eukprot:XP_001007348.1 amidase [Tetrahymena thermophila SB210]
MNFDLSNMLEKQIPVKYVTYLMGAYLGFKIGSYILRSAIKKVKIFIQKKKVRNFIQERNQNLKNLQIPTPNLTQDIIDKVLNSDITHLKKMLEAKSVTSEDLVNIFSKRAQQYGVEYGIITHLKYKEAIEAAKECDKLRKENSPLCQLPLFGIPISMKETIDEKGYPSTVGSIFRIDHIPKEDGFCAKLLKSGGAIPFLRTNVPQAGMIYESVNEVYGRVLNPWDKTKYSGGSSGGEGAAVAARMSPGGMGSDIGGSIRIPAAMCGVYGLKPTAQRSVMSGHTFYSEPFNGQKTVLCASGPICKSVDDLILFFRQLSDPQYLKKFKLQEIDTFFPLMQIDEAQLNNNQKQRRFGYFKTLKEFDCTLANQRAVEISVEKLRAQGHQLVEITLPNVEQIRDGFIQFLLSDELMCMKDLLSKEDFVKEYMTIEFFASTPVILKRILTVIFYLIGEKTFAQLLPNSNRLKVEELNKLQYNINKLQIEYLRLFDDHEIEAIICPSFGAPALPHSSSIDSAPVSLYTFIWNFLNFPCGVLPVTKVLKEEQHYNNSRTRELATKRLDHYMKQNTEGLPVNVQVVAPPYKEETCLNVMKMLDDDIQFYQHNSYPELK